VGRARHDYFRGVPRASTARVRRPPLRARDRSIADRAAELTAFVARSRAARELVAHSMGGLDARYALARLGSRELARSPRSARRTTARSPTSGAGSRGARRSGRPSRASA